MLRIRPTTGRAHLLKLNNIRHTYPACTCSCATHQGRDRPSLMYCIVQYVVRAILHLMVISVPALHLLWNLVFLFKNHFLRPLQKHLFIYCGRVLKTIHVLGQQLPTVVPDNISHPKPADCKTFYAACECWISDFSNVKLSTQYSTASSVSTSRA